MIINLSYKKKIIQSKDVHYPDNVNALNWMIDAFKHNFNIDISKYSLNKLKQSKNSSGTSSITIEIEDEDLKQWRDKRLTELLKK
jgi:hypothetical protein